MLYARAYRMNPTGIDEQAPVVSRHQTVIRAPLHVVWQLHTDIDAWPTWQTDISAARLQGPFGPGAQFTWRTGPLEVTSTVYALQPEHQTVWGGPAQGIDGIHVWMFSEAESGVLVQTQESWSGAPVEAQKAQMQQALDASLVTWLKHLTTAAEQRA